MLCACAKNRQGFAMSASRSGQTRRERFRDERELMKDIHNSMVVFADVRDAVRTAAGRIFQSGYEVNHDTLTECLRDDLFYAELSDNQHRQKVLTLALTTLELQRGRV